MPERTPFPDLATLDRQVHGCTKCALSATRTKAVPGEGSPTAAIVFIGEGPGYHEDQQGRPFVGPAGHLLDKLLDSIGLKRADVYITNMVKCRPPNNRDPFPGEIQACSGYMDEQLRLIGPKVVVTLGRHSFGKFFPGDTISKARGRPRQWNGWTIFPIYHPAAALHNPGLMPDLQADFQKLAAMLQGPAAEPVKETADQSQQLSLF
ncbi:MAG: uracil-DNA glycosylase [SAR202 cluster bacterium]|nr:uracil-DNA glycosylase [SAR202 cluster bacterium]